MARVFTIATACAWLMVAPAAGEAAQPQGADSRRYTPSEIRADFRDLYATLKRAHFDLYARRSKADYDRLFRTMLARIRTPETRDDVALRFQRFVAFGRVAHARIDGASANYVGYRSRGGAVFPLTLRITNGRAFISANCSRNLAVPEGAEILAIDGRPFKTVRARLAAHVSADTPYMMDSLLEYYFARVLWQEFGTAPAWRIAVRRAGAGRQVFSVPARSFADVSAACAAKPRLRLDAEGRTARMLAGNFAYLRPGPFYNNAPDAKDMYDNRAFRDFIDRAFTSFRSAKARALIIDLRDNPGGDSSFSDAMIAWFADKPFTFAASFRIRVSPETVASNAKRLATSDLPDGGVSAKLAKAYAGAANGAIVDFPVPVTQPRRGERFTAPVYVLINRASDSNTVFTAATIQDFGFGRIVGEETSDLASTLGAMEQFELPRTRIAVGYPKAKLVRPSGNPAGRGVVPDLPIVTPVIEGPEDPVLGQAVRLAANQR